MKLLMNDYECQARGWISATRKKILLAGQGSECYPIQYPMTLLNPIWFGKKVVKKGCKTKCRGKGVSDNVYQTRSS